MRRFDAALWLATLAVLLSARPGLATWSIIIVDTQTKEIGVASPTSLSNFDLRRGLPVLRVGKGAVWCWT